jgi:hypothetical protein
MPGNGAIGAMHGDDLTDNQMRARPSVANLDRLVQATFEMNRRFCDPGRPNEGRWQGVEADFVDFTDRWWDIVGINLGLFRNRFRDRVDDKFVRLE